MAPDRQPVRIALNLIHKTHLPELFEGGIGELFVELSDTKELASKINLLRNKSKLCRQMVSVGTKKEIRVYRSDVY